MRCDGSMCWLCPTDRICSGPVVTETRHCVICGEVASEFRSGLCPACQQRCLRNRDMMRDFAEDRLDEYYDYCAEMLGEES